MNIDNFISNLIARRALAIAKDGGGASGTHAPYTPPVGRSTIKGSPGLITSTGGLIGTNFKLLMPLFDSVFNKTYLALIDPNDNDTEEFCFYTFKSEDIQPNRNVSVHKIILIYRELGEATFTVGVQTYLRDADDFKTLSRQVKITKPKKRRTGIPFPDGKLHEKKVDLIIAGERPQIFITREARSGPLCITSVLICGKADEKDQL